MAETIYQGGYKVLNFTLYKNAALDPFDASAATEIKALFCPATGTTLLERSLTGGHIALTNGQNKGSITLDSAFSATILAEEPGGFELEVTIAGEPYIFQFNDSINVFERKTC